MDWFWEATLGWGLVSREANPVEGWNFQFEQTQGDGERQGSLACCSPWGHKESDTTERPISTSKIWDEKRSWEVEPVVKASDVINHTQETKPL